MDAVVDEEEPPSVVEESFECSDDFDPVIIFEIFVFFVIIQVGNANDVTVWMSIYVN